MIELGMHRKIVCLIVIGMINRIGFMDLGVHNSLIKGRNGWLNRRRYAQNNGHRYAISGLLNQIGKHGTRRPMERACDDKGENDVGSSKHGKPWNECCKFKCMTTNLSARDVWVL